MKDGSEMSKRCLSIKKRKAVLQNLRQESGMMVVEALLSFTVFVMVISAIVYLITIFTLHNRVQFAINSAAHELASYSYIYQALGLKAAGEAMEKDGAPYVGTIDDTATQLIDTLNKVEHLSQSAANAGESIESLSPSEIQSSVSDLIQDTKDTADSASKSASHVKKLFSNPKDTLVGVIYLAENAALAAAKSEVATWAATGMTQKYLAVGELSADDYLKRMGVRDGYEGLDFSGSTMFCDPDRKLIDIVVEYDVDLSFVWLIIPDAKLHVIQRVTVAGWLEGYGEPLESYGIRKR